MGDKAIARLTSIYQASFLLGATPLQAGAKRKSSLSPNRGKTIIPYHDPFGPITLSNVMLKIMERVVQRELDNTCFRENPLHPMQHAFRTGRGTDTALSDLVDTIEGAFTRKEYALGVFLDIQGAFDNVIPDRVLGGPALPRGARDHLYAGTATTSSAAPCSTEYKGVTVRRALTLGTPAGRSALPSDVERLL